MAINTLNGCSQYFMDTVVPRLRTEFTNLGTSYTQGNNYGHITFEKTRQYKGSRKYNGMSVWVNPHLQENREDMTTPPAIISGFCGHQIIRYVQYVHIEGYCNLEEKETKSTQVLNALKRSSIAEHLVNHPTCANNYKRDRFKIIKSCKNVFDLIKLEAIYILLRKPILCKHKDFDYTVSLFS